MKPYPEYKETGLSWLPKIPTHWKVVRTKSLFRLVVEAAPINNDYELLSVYSHIGVRPRRDLEAKGNRASTTDGYWIVKKGDIICNKLLAWMGAIGVSHYDGVTSPAYDIIRRRNEESEVEYYHYLFRTPLYQSVFRAFSKGIMDMRLRLYFDQFGTISIPCPPIAEQKKIVRYLDLMAAKIDTLIDAKKKQIALLQEKKQAIVNQVVTRGLNPDVQLKDSGIDWLGKIPVHWEVNKVGHMFSSVLGKMLASSPTSESDTLENYICAKDVHFSGIDISDLKQMWFSREEKLLYSVKQGDLLIVEGGAGAGGAFVYREEKKCYIQNSIHLVRPRSKCFSVDFLYYWMYALIGKNYIPYACNKATIPHFTKDKLFETPFPVVPEEEQKVIVFYLEKEFRKIDNASSIFEKEISLYQEYKASLISDLVSGRICS